MKRCLKFCVLVAALAPVPTVSADWDRDSFDDGNLEIFVLYTDVDYDLDNTEVILQQQGDELEFTITETRNGQVVDVDGFDVDLDDYDEIWVLGGPNSDHLELLEPLTIDVRVILYGGVGNDVLRGPAELYGHNGKNLLVGGLYMRGGNYDDTLIAGPLTRVIDGNSGRNYINAAQANGVTIRGGRRADIIIGSPGNDSISGGPGNDIILGGGGNDDLAGNEGLDMLFGEDGADTLDAGPLETRYGTVLRESVYGNAGRDTFKQQDVNYHYTDYSASNDNLTQPFWWFSTYRNVSTFSIGF